MSIGSARLVGTLPPFVFAAGLILVALAYTPGLSGPFLFDDLSNLNGLGAYGPLHDLPTWLFYLSSGIADPIGRPLSLLSFLADGRTWPTSPWPFKVSNLLLHLLNAALLWRILVDAQAHMARSGERAPHAWVPVFAALAWAAHPLFVSTTLYVVQRQAMLPATFALLALFAWMRALDGFQASSTLRGWTWAIFGVGGATLLGTLSKANGALAPLLIGIAHVTFLQTASQATARKAIARCALVCLYLPAAAVLGYLLLQGWQLWDVRLPSRDWTLPERLLTQPRVFWSYVGHLTLPRAGGGGVFVEDFMISRDWWEPRTTLLAITTLLASVLAASALRHRFPRAAFAWLFFVAGHSLEGSTIPLELYFEHRNYLPAMFLGWPVAQALLVTGADSAYRRVFPVVFLSVLLLLTYQRATLWGDERLLARVSVVQQPGSRRAQAHAAASDINSGQTVEGLGRLHAAQSFAPDSVDIAVNRLGAECGKLGALSSDALLKAKRALATSRHWNYGLYEWMQLAARDPGMQACKGFGLAGLESLVTVAEHNPHNNGPRRLRDLQHVRGHIALARHRPPDALRRFNAALRLEPDADYALVQAAALGDAGAYSLGAAHLDHYLAIAQAQHARPIRDMPTLHAWLLRHYGYYEREVTSLRERLCQDARTTASPCR